jgi:hypothetical protein
MAYVPPSRRKSNTFVINSFKKNQKSNVTHPKKEIVNIDSNESFPTLGNVSSSAQEQASAAQAQEQTKKPTFDYLSSMFKKMPKKEKVKQIKDGWVHINKSKMNPTITFTFGEKSKKRIQFEEYLDYCQDMRRIKAYHKLLDTYEEYEALDLFLNGEKYINGWEYNDYMKELELQRKYEEMENMSSDEETSEDDYDNYEFN